MNYYGRRRYSRYPRYSRYARRYNRTSTSATRRAAGNYRAALQQRDATSVNLSISSNIDVTNKPVDITNYFLGANYDQHLGNAGSFAINIWDLLRRSSFYQSYANMYDQIKIDRIRIKLTPAGFVTSSTNDYKPYTVVTAWDRSGLSNEQLQWNTARLGEVNGPGDAIIGGYHQRPDEAGQDRTKELWISISPDDIATYSSAVTKPVTSGANSSIVRTLYPRTAAEKGFYVNTADIDRWYQGIGPDGNWYGIKNARAIEATTITVQADGQNRLLPLYNTMDVVDSNAVARNPCFVGESPMIPFKPTLLVGLLNSDPIIKGSGDQQEAVQPEMKLFVEADIGVTFRGLRKASIVQ